MAAQLHSCMAAWRSSLLHCPRLLDTAEYFSTGNFLRVEGWLEHMAVALNASALPEVPGSDDL